MAFGFGYKIIRVDTLRTLERATQIYNLITEYLLLQETIEHGGF
jgi:hypothetical protein